ncbi:hypothetical protein Cs7R123_52860 [Catellatospora sp. TT07R-123]|nr:hypothetical protein Cs7R123_52860 [Catellatospora sp. TT07R-123]
MHQRVPIRVRDSRVSDPVRGLFTSARPYPNSRIRAAPPGTAEPPPGWDGGSGRAAGQAAPSNCTCGSLWAAVPQTASYEPVSPAR